MKFVTVIPARGGSKRFPGKNIHPLCGKPLIAYSIDYSVNNLLVSDTYVSTDYQDIKDVALQYRAKVLDRPAELGGDFVTSDAVMQNAAETLVKYGVEFDYIILLQVTNPLRPARMLDEAIKIIEEKKYDSLFAVNKSELKLGRIVDGQFMPWNYHYGQRSQDMEPLYYENGLLYISSKELLLSGRIRGDQLYPMVVDHIFGEVDIDTRDDMKYAEFVLINYSNE